MEYFVATMEHKQISANEVECAFIEYTNLKKEETEKVEGIKGFIEKLGAIKESIVYLYELRIEGEFFLYWLKTNGYEIGKDFELTVNSQSQWFRLIIHTENGDIELRDAKKLIPLEMDEIRDSFGDLGDDLHTLKNALKQMHDEGFKRMTIGSCALDTYKKMMSSEFSEFFPEITEEEYAFIEESYRGGWVYCVEGNAGHGYTLDDNSLYPSVMADKSNFYPVGKPLHVEDKEARWKECLEHKKSNYFFVKFSVETFSLKDGALPFITRQHDMRYALAGCLSSSKYHDFKTNKMIEPKEPLEFTMTMTDYKLFIKYYDFTGFKFIDAMFFSSISGNYLFWQYVHKFYTEKMTSTGGKRQIKKLLLNNLGGKFSSSSKSDYKVPRLKENGSFTYDVIKENNRKTVYLPVGCAMTAYGREVTVTRAIENKDIFRYSDTDSLHLETDSIENIKGLEIDDKKLGAWKVESEWDNAKFLRSKAYVEHDVKKGHIIKCAGLPEKGKQEFINNLESGKCTYDDFDYGCVFHGKRVPKHVKGGVILTEIDFTLNENAIAHALS